MEYTKQTKIEDIQSAQADTGLEYEMDVENETFDPAQKAEQDLDSLLAQMEGEEDISRRGECEKHFDFGGNRHQAVLYPEPVHYLSAGRWEEIDSNLEEGQDESGRQVLRTRAGAYLAELPRVADGGALVTVTGGGRTLSWQFEGKVNPAAAQVATGTELRRRRLAQLAGESRTGGQPGEKQLLNIETAQQRRMDLTKKSCEAQYDEILDGVSVRYRLSGGQIKEDIILKDASALSRAALKLQEGYGYLVNPDQSVTVVGGGKPLFQFEIPVVYDAEGEMAIAQTVVEPCPGYVRMRYEIGQEFLDRAVYPITIDPVVKLTADDSRATWVSYNITNPEHTGVQRTGKSMYLGKSRSDRVYATAIRFDKLAALKSSDTVTSAKLTVYPNSVSKSKGHYVGAYEITKAWTAGATKYREMEVSADVLDYAVGGKREMTLNLTNLYRQWYRAKKRAEEAENYGVMLKCMPASQKYFTLHSPNSDTKEKRPVFAVNYISHAGLADWGTYESQSAGRAGTMHVDLFNGNLVHEHADTAMGGSRMPVSIGHYYNSSQADDSKGGGYYDYHCGKGWKHSGLQRIYRKKINSTHYRVWVDGNGTEHWFKEAAIGRESLDLEGQQLRMTRRAKTGDDSERIEIEDKSHTKMIFQKRPGYNFKATWKDYWLIKLEDTASEKNTVRYRYVTPVAVTDKEKGRVTSKQLREQEGKLLRIYDGAGRVTEFTYDEGNGQLKWIDTPESTSDAKLVRRVEFGYDAHKRLTTVSYLKVEEDPANPGQYITVSELTDHPAPHTRYGYLENIYMKNGQQKREETGLLTRASNYDGITVAADYEQCTNMPNALGIDEKDDTSGEEKGIEEEEGSGPPEPVEKPITYDICRAVSLETARMNGDFSAVVIGGRGAKQIFTYKPMTTQVTVVESAEADAVTGKMIVYQFNDKGNVTCVMDELGFAQFAKYESGHANTPSAVSKLQKAVINRVRRADFVNQNSELETSVWKTHGSVSENNTVTIDGSASGLCLNMKSAKLSRGNEVLDGGADVFGLRQTVRLERGKAYTFSAYVRAESVLPNPQGGGAHIQISAEGITKTSPQLVYSTEDDYDNGLPTDNWERQRVSIEIPGAAGSFVDAAIRLLHGGNEGTVWYAAPQVEEGKVANSVNLLANGDFMNAKEPEASGYTPPYDWSAGADVNKSSTTGVRPREIPTGYDPVPVGLPGNYLRMRDRTRSKGRDSFFYQTLNVGGNKGHVFFAGGWGSAKAVPGTNGEVRAFRIHVRFECKDEKSGKMKWVPGRGGRIPFTSEWVGWQAAGGAVIAPRDFTRIRVYLMYKGNPNGAKFTNIFLYREEFGRSFVYDKNKNVVTNTQYSGQQEGMEYDREYNLISYRKPGTKKSDKITYKMTYGKDSEAKKRHQLATATTPEGLVTGNKYDKHGNITMSQTRDAKTSLFMRTLTEYDGEVADGAGKMVYKGGNYMVKATDARGKTVERTVDKMTGMLYSAKDANGTTLNYSYTKEKQLSGVQVQPDVEDLDRVYKNEYSYEDSRLKTVTHNTSPVSTGDVQYIFEYDPLGAVTQVKVGKGAQTRVLSENTYAQDRSHKLLISTYGNGGSMHNRYDEFDRLIGIRFDDDIEDRYGCEYGANGQPAYATHWEKDRQGVRRVYRTHNTEYDVAGRPRRATAKDGEGNIFYRATLKYNKYDQLVDFAEQVPGKDNQQDDDGTQVFTTKYNYDKDDRVTKIKYDDDQHFVDYKFDKVGRVYKMIIQNGAEMDGEDVVSRNDYGVAYTFVEGGHPESSRVNKSTTPLVSSIQRAQVNDEGKLGITQEEWSYTYDNVGNILSAQHKLSGDDHTVSYAYDKLGQLLRVNDPTDKLANQSGTTWLYSYDLGGNILEKRMYPYTAPEVQINPVQNPGVLTEYKYQDAGWKDKLTSYDGTPIQYDAIGNPTRFGEWSYTWQKGRQLARMQKGEGAQSTRIEYMYDVEDLRTQKKVIGQGETITTEYVMHGKLLSHMVWKKEVAGLPAVQEELHFFYGNEGKPQMVFFRENMYTYLHNVQGDITGILDNRQNLVVEYGYDAWGRITGESNKAADGSFTQADAKAAQALMRINPFRYRGYVYDGETGLYYLRSRYYNPGIGRFSNEDSIAGANSILIHNMFTYCLNNPVRRADDFGTDSEEISYFIYDPFIFPPNIGSDMDAYIKELNEYHNGKFLAVPVSSPEQFTAAWNEMGIVDGEERSIRNVVIFTHATAKFLSFKGSDYKFTGNFYSSEIKKLDQKKIETVILLGCKLAKKVQSGNNFAKELHVRQPGIDEVIASKYRTWHSRFRTETGQVINVVSSKGWKAHSSYYIGKKTRILSQGKFLGLSSMLELFR